MNVRVAVFVLCALACLAAHAAIVASVLTRRAATVNPAVPRPKPAVELIWALVPLVGLLLVLAATWPAVRRANVAATDAVAHVHAVALD